MAKESVDSEKSEKYLRLLPISEKTNEENQKSERGPDMTRQYTNKNQDSTQCHLAFKVTYQEFML